MSAAYPFQGAAQAMSSNTITIELSPAAVALTAQLRMGIIRAMDRWGMLAVSGEGGKGSVLPINNFYFRGRDGAQRARLGRASV